MKKLFYAIIFITVLSVSQVGAMTTMSWNGQAVEPDSTLAIRFGANNTLAVSTDEDGRQKVIVVKSLPDGNSEKMTARLTKDNPAQFQIGPMTSPVEYLYEHGMIFYRGYHIEITVQKKDADSARWCHTQKLVEDKGFALLPGSQYKQPFPYGWRTNFDGGTNRMRPTYYIRLNSRVLTDQDHLEVQFTSSNIPRLLEITDAKGKVIHRQDINNDSGSPAENTLRGNELMEKWKSFAWRAVKVDPALWPMGDYKVALWAKVGGKIWREGPVVNYRRRKVDPLAVQISPYTLWTLKRDKSRQEIILDNMKTAYEKIGSEMNEDWYFDKNGSLLNKGNAKAAPVEYRPKLKGYYALFAATKGSMLVQAGDKGLVHDVRSPRCLGTKYVFVTAGDLTSLPLRIYQLKSADQELRAIRLVPVTAKSVRRFYKTTSNPTTPLLSVADWGCYFGSDSRLERDQIELISSALPEIGLKTLDWSVGRSTLDYHSKLPGVTVFPYESEREKCNPVWAGRANVNKRFDALDVACKHRKQSGAEIWGWLAMNRHYGGGFFSACTSKFSRDNRNLAENRKNGERVDSRLCYFFPKIRKERVDILLEVADRGVDGLLLGACRQPPMMLYHPDMVQAYIKKTGIDPRKIDSSNKKQYTDWIAWRADHFTQVLRDLHKGLKAKGLKTPVAVRIPSAGLFRNLAQGLDVLTWCKEGLIDRLQLDPLADGSSTAQRDMRPYIKLGQKYDITIIGGVGATWFLHYQLGYMPGLKRALSLMETGVEGIEIYETEVQAISWQNRWLIPLYGHKKLLRDFLKNSNLEACFPIHSLNAGSVHDNHSFGRMWSTGGFHGYSM